MKRKLVSLLLVAVIIATFGTFTIAEGKPTLRYLGRDATFDLANSPMIPILEKLTGYKMEFEALPVGDEGLTKMMLLLSSGRPYDLVNVNPNYFDYALAAGAVMPLDDLLPLAPALLESVPADSTSWPRVTGEDGKIYGIPQLSPTGGPVTAVAVRKDILDELSIELPTTPEELYDALVAIKNAYPEMIPLTTSLSKLSLSPILSAYGMYESWKNVDGMYLPIQLREETRAYYGFLNKLYMEGLLDVEFPANTDAMRLSKFASGQAAMTFFHSSEGPGFYSALAEAVPTAVIDYLPFMVDANGNAGVQVDIGLEKICFIPKNAANPEAAIDYVNEFMSNFKEIYIGAEGVDHEVVDGGYRPIMPAFSVHDTVWWFMPSVDEVNVHQWWRARVRKSAEVERGYMDTFALKEQEGLIIINNPLSMTKPNNELSKLSTLTSQNWNDEMVKIITGAVAFEEYDNAVEKWKIDGGERIVEIVNEILAE